jgi:CubicO group peptidase (beta-lactamase class C family)
MDARKERLPVIGLKERRYFLESALCTFLAACGGVASSLRTAARIEPGPVTQRNVDDAIAQLDRLVTDLMASSGVPGMAVAVVRGDQTVYAKGFGTRLVGTSSPVDADTVFQLASVSKSVGATAVAREVGEGRVAWDSPMRGPLPWFMLANEATTQRVTIGDLYAHRSGLPNHAGDRLEDMGYDQREVLERLRYLPLGAFRNAYAYTNFGLTAGGVAAAVAAGVDWATLVEQAIYAPLGMSRTSSRFADFAGRSNRVTGHRQVDGKWVPVLPPRMPDAQAPAASVTSSVNDMSKWLAMLLGNGVYAGRRIVDAAALAAAVSPQMEISPARNGFPASYTGYGFDVGTTAQGRKTYSHSGAFEMGTATTFKVVPSTGLALIALTNGYPIGVPEILAAQFFDVVEHGAIQRDWAALAAPIFAAMNAPEGALVGVARPMTPAPSRPLADYVGIYRNDYHGPLTVTNAGDALSLVLGPTPLRLPLVHWDGDVFTFTLDNENARPGTLSKASFARDRVTLEYYDREGLGTFLR